LIKLKEKKIALIWGDSYAVYYTRLAPSLVDGNLEKSLLKKIVINACRTLSWSRFSLVVMEMELDLLRTR